MRKQSPAHLLRWSRHCKSVMEERSAMRRAIFLLAQDWKFLKKISIGEKLKKQYSWCLGDEGGRRVPSWHSSCLQYISSR